MSLVESPGMSFIELPAFISGVSPKHNMALSLSSHPWMAAFQPLSSSSLLLCSLLFSLSFLSTPPSLLIPCASVVTCVMLCFMSCETLHCSRLNYNLDVADRLADEHVLIGLYVNLLQNNPKTWLVGVLLCLPDTSGNYVLLWTATLAVLPLSLTLVWVRYSSNAACWQTVLQTSSHLDLWHCCQRITAIQQQWVFLTDFYWQSRKDQIWFEN